MKKKIFGGVAVLAIAMAVAFHVNLNRSKTSQLSLLALANVEALAQVESGDYCDMYGPRCWYPFCTAYYPLPRCYRSGEPRDYCRSL